MACSIHIHKISTHVCVCVWVRGDGVKIVYSYGDTVSPFVKKKIIKSLTRSNIVNTSDFKVSV